MDVSCCSFQLKAVTTEVIVSTHQFNHRMNVLYCNSTLSQSFLQREISVCMRVLMSTRVMAVLVFVSKCTYESKTKDAFSSPSRQLH